MRHYIKEASMNGSLTNASLPLSHPSSSAQPLLPLDPWPGWIFGILPSIE